MPAQQPSIKEQVATIRRLSGNEMRAFERRDEVTRLIIEDLKKAGRFFKTQERNFYFHKSDKPKLFPIEIDGAALKGLILTRYGINPAESREFAHLIEGLDNEANSNGEEVPVRRLSYFEIETGRLYVSSFNGRVYRLNGRSIRQVPNGIDGVFFYDDPSWEPYGITRDKIKTPMLANVLLDSANFAENGELSCAEQQWLFSTWCLSHFFGSYLPTKPLLLICGEKGGGTTLSLRKWIKLLFGNKADVLVLERSKQDGFVAAVCSVPIAVFKWLENGSNHGRVVTSGTLNDALIRIALLQDIKWPYRSANALGQRLSHITTNLKERFRVEAKQDSSNQWQYQFWPKAETLNRAESHSELLQAA